MRTYRFITGVDPVETVQKYMKDNDMTPSDLFEMFDNRYPVKYHTFVKAISGLKPMAPNFWVQVGRVIGIKLATQAAPDGTPRKSHSPKRLTEYSTIRETPPIPDEVWIARNLRNFGNCIVSDKLLKANPDLLSKLSAEGLYAKIERDKLGGPKLVLYTDEELTFRVYDDEDLIFRVED